MVVTVDLPVAGARLLFLIGAALILLEGHPTDNWRWVGFVALTVSVTWLFELRIRRLMRRLVARDAEIRAQELRSI